MFDENKHTHPQNNDEGRQRRFLLAGASPPQSTAETDTDASV